MFKVLHNQGEFSLCLCYLSQPSLSCLRACRVLCSEGREHLVQSLATAAVLVAAVGSAGGGRRSLDREECSSGGTHAGRQTGGRTGDSRPRVAGEASNERGRGGSRGEKRISRAPGEWALLLVVRAGRHEREAEGRREEKQRGSGGGGQASKKDSREE